MRVNNNTYSLTTTLAGRIAQAIVDADGWLPFDRFMHMALYTPGLGYYANDLRKLGLMPGASGADDKSGNGGGSDFVTAPELSPLFGKALAAQIAEAMAHTGTDEVWEFGAGSGALALQLLKALQARGQAVRRYVIVDVSSALRARQQETLREFAQGYTQVEWVSELPASLQGVIVGNEVLDAMPVKLLARVKGVWNERGVALDGDAFAWADKPTDLRPSVEVSGEHDYLTEIHPQGEAFMRTLADKLKRGAAFFIDYGFPEAEYYHPQRHMGTVMCHRAHLSDMNPLVDVGLKDITAHVNFTGMALAAQEQGQGLTVLGYTSQGRFLLNCGLAQMMAQADLPTRANANKLLMEHEMGELFKVMGLCAGEPWGALGFASGDRTHAL